MSCLPTFLQNGRDCFLLACVEGHQEIVHELLTKDKVDQNVVDKVRNSLSLFVHCVMVCVTHVQDGRGAVHLACEGGHTQLVQTLVKEFRMSPNIRDNVSINIMLPRIKGLIVQQASSATSCIPPLPGPWSRRASLSEHSDGASTEESNP